MSDHELRSEERLSNVQVLRIQRGLTQQGLADKAGLSVSTIHRMEAPGLHLLVETACLVATALNVDVDSLFSEMELRYDGPGHPPGVHDIRRPQPTHKVVISSCCRVQVSFAELERHRCDFCGAALVAA